MLIASYCYGNTANFLMSLIQYNIHCMFHNVSHTVQHYLQVSVSLTHLTTPHFLFYNALYLLIVLQYPFYSSTLPASFTMPLTQFNNPCQFLKCPSFRLTLPATCAMSLIQFRTSYQLHEVPCTVSRSVCLYIHLHYWQCLDLILH